MKKILFVLRKPPHSGAYGQEVLDIVMTAAAFDQEVSILLLDSAVFHLKRQQQLEHTGLSDTAAMFKALPLYNIKTFYAETESLTEYGLATDDLSESITTIARQTVSELFKQFDLVLPG